jgi:hypothetical protein
VGKRRYALARLANRDGIYVGGDYTGMVSRFGENFSPRGHDQTMAKRGAAVLMTPSLGGGEQITAGLDGARSR